MVSKEINSGAQMITLAIRRILLALDSMGIRRIFAPIKTLSMQFSLPLLSISSSAVSSGSVASVSTTSGAPSLVLVLAAPTSSTGQVQTGVYDTSTTPSYLPWNTYNYCNAPHVNAAHYTMPKDASAEMVYMNVMIRHHKVKISVIIIPLSF